MSYDNNAHSKQISKWVKSSWGVGRLYRRMKYLYPNHGPTILLRQIITIAKKEGVLFSWRSIYAVMKKEQFLPTEKNAIRNWVKGLENESIYAQETSPEARLRGKRQEPLIQVTPNGSDTHKTHIEVTK